MAQIKEGDIAKVIDSYSIKVPNGTIVRIKTVFVSDGQEYAEFTDLNNAERKRSWRVHRFEAL